MLGERPRVDGLDLPPDGIDVPSIIRFLRQAAADLREAQCTGSWLIVEGSEAIGLCSYKTRPDPTRTVEIGYGIAAERRGRGHAAQAVALMLREARSDPAIDRVTAETATGNAASQSVLQRNGFVRVGARGDPEEGELILWSIDVSTGRTDHL